MGDQIRLLKRGPDVFVKNEPIVGNKDGPPSGEYRRATRGRFDIESPTLGLRDNELIGAPRIETPSDRLSMKVSSGLAGNLDPIHFSRRPPSATPASLQVYRRRSGAVQM